ncbi:MAG: hypothetical protein EA379_03180 [Phycisphaerales bacterium]|nr:MAG: hypothetical protein EA379_03180 [Phycisphaerales bacterium]
MYALQHTKRSLVPTSEFRLASPPIRSYAQIASILTSKWQEPITPRQAERLCRNAETKLVNALLTGI